MSDTATRTRAHIATRSALGPQRQRGMVRTPRSDVCPLSTFSRHAQSTTNAGLAAIPPSLPGRQHAANGSSHANVSHNTILHPAMAHHPSANIALSPPPKPYDHRVFALLKPSHVQHDHTGSRRCVSSLDCAWVVSSVVRYSAARRLGSGTFVCITYGAGPWERVALSLACAEATASLVILAEPFPRTSFSRDRAGGDPQLPLPVLLPAGHSVRQSPAHRSLIATYYARSRGQVTLLLVAPAHPPTIFIPPSDL